MFIESRFPRPQKKEAPPAVHLPESEVEPVAALSFSEIQSEIFAAGSLENRIAYLQRLLSENTAQETFDALNVHEMNQLHLQLELYESIRDLGHDPLVLSRPELQQKLAVYTKQILMPVNANTATDITRYDRAAKGVADMLKQLYDEKRQEIVATLPPERLQAQNREIRALIQILSAGDLRSAVEWFVPAEVLRHEPGLLEEVQSQLALAQSELAVSGTHEDVYDGTVSGIAAVENMLVALAQRVDVYINQNKGVWKDQTHEAAVTADAHEKLQNIGSVLFALDQASPPLPNLSETISEQHELLMQESLLKKPEADLEAALEEEPGFVARVSAELKRLVREGVQVTFDVVQNIGRQFADVLTPARVGEAVAIALLITAKIASADVGDAKDAGHAPAHLFITHAPDAGVFDFTVAHPDTNPPPKNTLSDSAAANIPVTGIAAADSAEHAASVDTVIVVDKNAQKEAVKAQKEVGEKEKKYKKLIASFIKHFNKCGIAVTDSMIMNEEARRKIFTDELLPRFRKWSENNANPQIPENRKRPDNCKGFEDIEELRTEMGKFSLFEQELVEAYEEVLVERAKSDDQRQREAELVRDKKRAEEEKARKEGEKLAKKGGKKPEDGKIEPAPPLAGGGAEPTEQPSAPKVPVPQPATAQPESLQVAQPQLEQLPPKPEKLAPQSVPEQNASAGGVDQKSYFEKPLSHVEQQNMNNAEQLLRTSGWLKPGEELIKKLGFDVKNGFGPVRVSAGGGNGVVELGFFQADGYTVAKIQVIDGKVTDFSPVGGTAVREVSPQQGTENAAPEGGEQLQPPQAQVEVKPVSPAPVQEAAPDPDIATANTLLRTARWLAEGETLESKLELKPKGGRIEVRIVQGNLIVVTQGGRDIFKLIISSNRVKVLDIPNIPKKED